ncbi:hypothetical protein AURDEDRAFT_128085 [Auricularia subglabra TFB-10046 SS5]|uniref:Fungal N-terminal domain-containing protein n=1 Tax=Auricularia subglabra (strain TFB-10046 / SS5) TaxID=717982 RepID=J0D1K7_AURST|nr:hypothetical protein AURDEDRAFT_128085 [Auricularia subglabra TFB-10046 SS5]
MPIVTFTAGSLGDIIAIIDLANQLRTALCEAKGAPAEVKALGSDLEDFVSVLKQAKLALLRHGSNFEPETQEGIKACLERCAATLSSIQHRVAVFATRLAARHGRQAVRAYLAALSWQFLGGRKEVEDLRARLSKHASLIHMWLSLSQCNGQRALHDTAVRTKVAVEGILCIVQARPPPVASRFPGFELYDRRTKTSYQAFAVVPLHLLAAYLEPLIAHIGAQHAELELNHEHRTWPPTCGPSKKGNHLRSLPSLPPEFAGAEGMIWLSRNTSILGAKLHIECRLVSPPAGHSHVVLGIPPFGQAPTYTEVLLEVLNGNGPDLGEPGLYEAERQRGCLVRRTSRYYSHLIRIAPPMEFVRLASSFASSESMTVWDGLRKLPDPDSIKSSSVIRELEHMKNYGRTPSSTERRMSLQEACDLAHQLHTELLALLHNAPPIKEDWITHSAMSEALWGSYMGRTATDFRYSDILGRLFDI